MNSIQVFALARQLMTFAGTYVVATGVVTASQFDTIAGSALALASVGWSLYASRKDRMVAKVAALPEVATVRMVPTLKGDKLADKVESEKVVSAG